MITQVREGFRSINGRQSYKLLLKIILTDMKILPWPGRAVVWNIDKFPSLVPAGPLQSKVCLSNFSSKKSDKTLVRSVKRERERAKSDLTFLTLTLHHNRPTNRCNKINILPQLRYLSNQGCQEKRKEDSTKTGLGLHSI